MTPAEAAALLAVCAAFDNRKPDADAAKAWAMALDGHGFEDCRNAVVEHYKTSREWIMVADVIAAVKRVRAKRLQDYGYVLPPAELGSNPAAEQVWLLETKQAIADGTLKPGDLPERPGELLARVMPDWDRMLPTPERPTRAQVAAEAKRARPADYDQHLADVKADLAARGPQPMPGLDDEPAPPTPPRPSGAAANETEPQEVPA